MSNEISLPRFRKALEPFAKKLATGTYWRYSNGILPPPFGTLLLEHPELARALADDAAELATRSKPEDTNEGRG